MSNISLTNISKNWKEFLEEGSSRQQQACLLFGTPNGGKSSFCELVLKNVADSKNQNLVFDESKTVKQYVLPGIISGNVFKIQTLKPKVYEVQPKNIDAPKDILIDLPSSCLAPSIETFKKIYSTLDSKISSNLLLMSIKRASFVLIIEEKHTRVPNVLRSILANFIDLFSESLETIPSQIMECTAIVISKAPQMKLELLLKKFQGCNKKIQDNKTKKINQWLENLKQRNAIYFFKKFVNQDLIKQEVKSLYKQITKLNKIQMEPKFFQTIGQFPQQTKQEALEYFRNLQRYMEKSIGIIFDISHKYFKNYVEFSKKKEIIGSQIFGIEKNKDHEKYQQKELPNIMNLLEVCSQISHFSEELEKNPKLSLKSLLYSLKKIEMIEENQEAFNHLQEICYLNDKFRNFDENFPWNIQGLVKILQKVNQMKKEKEMLNQIANNFENRGKQKEYYERIRKILEFLLTKKEREQSKIASQLWIGTIMCLSEMEKNKGKALKDLIELQTLMKEQKLSKLLGNLLEKIANLLISLNQLPNAIGLYYKSGNPQTAIDKMNDYLKKNSLKGKKIEQFIPYLNFLQNIGLYQQSYRFCVYLGSSFDTSEDRKKLEVFLSKNPSAPSKEYLKIFIEKSIDGLSKEEMKGYIKLAERIAGQQKQE